MRIVMVNAYARVVGGADRHCLALAAGLRDRGHEVSFLSTADSENLEGDGEFVELTVSHSTRDALPPRRRARAALNALWNRDAAEAMRRIIRDRRPDLVHSHRLYPQLSVAPLVACDRLKVPVVQTLHDYELIAASPVDHRGRWLDRDETKFQYRLLNDVTQLPRRTLHRRLVREWVAISRYQAGAYAQQGVEARVLPNFTEPPAGSPPELSERSGAVYAGRLTEEKGAPDVIALARGRPQLQVTIAGDGRLRETVRDAADELPNLAYVGELDKAGVGDLLRAARVLLAPSRWQEPGGLAALEAMAVGTPVLAFDAGGLAEYVRDADGGLVVSPDPRALIEGCDRLIGEDDEWRRCSERGLASVAEAHSPERYLSEIEDVYRRASGGLAASP